MEWQTGTVHQSSISEYLPFHEKFNRAIVQRQTNIHALSQSLMRVRACINIESHLKRVSFAKTNILQIK